MKNHFNPKSILIERGCSLFETAMQIHDRYVSCNSDSMENVDNPNFFKIYSVVLSGKDYIINILENNPHGLANRFQSTPYNADELIDVLCGGKIKCGVRRFNTKEARFETRVKVALESLASLEDTLITEKEIRQKIAEGILRDNSSALLATHWLTQLESLVGFGEDDVMHVFWCIFINWDENAEVLKMKFPLEDSVLIEKDIAVLDASKAALGLPSSKIKSEFESVVAPSHINKLIIEINNMFIKICGHAALNPKQVQFLSDYFALRAAGDIATIESREMLKELSEINKHMGAFVKAQAEKQACHQMGLFASAAVSADSGNVSSEANYRA